MEAVLEFIKTLTYGNPAIFRNLAISQLVGESREKDFLLLKEALGQGLVIKEQKSQAVAALDVENRTGSKILLTRGLYVVGGGQNRQVATSALLAEGYTGTIPTQCVERSRWDHHGKRTFDYGGITTVATRLTDTHVHPMERQERVWRSVEETISGTRTTAPTRDLDKVYEQQEAKLEEYLSNFSIAEKQLGIVAIIGINGKRKFIADIFDSHDALMEMFEDLVKSYALEAMTKTAKKVAATKADIEWFLQTFRAGGYAEESHVSLGTNYAFKSDMGEGTTLIDGNRIRYATAALER